MEPKVLAFAGCEVRYLIYGQKGTSYERTVYLQVRGKRNNDAIGQAVKAICDDANLRYEGITWIDDGQPFFLIVTPTDEARKSELIVYYLTVWNLWGQLGVSGWRPIRDHETPPAEVLDAFKPPVAA